MTARGAAWRKRLQDAHGCALVTDRAAASLQVIGATDAVSHMLGVLESELDVDEHLREVAERMEMEIYRRFTVDKKRTVRSRYRKKYEVRTEGEAYVQRRLQPSAGRLPRGARTAELDCRQKELGILTIEPYNLTVTVSTVTVTRMVTRTRSKPNARRRRAATVCALTPQPHDSTVVARGHLAYTTYPSSSRSSMARATCALRPRAVNRRVVWARGRPVRQIRPRGAQCSHPPCR